MSHEDKTLNPMVLKYYGTYRGIVRNSFDPDEKGLVQVEVLPMMKGIDTADLPWAEPKWPLNRIQIPQEGATVWVQFEGGDVYKPIYEYMAMPVQKVDGEDVSLDGNHEWKSTEAGEYAKATEKADAAADAIGGSKAPQYPYRDIFTSPSGIVIEIDDTPDNQRILIFHPSGTGVQIDKDTLTVKAAKPLNLNVEGDIQIEATGNVDVVAGGDAKVEATGKAVVEAPDIQLGDGATAGVVTTAHTCAFTGAPHPVGSAIVKAKG